MLPMMLPKSEASLLEPRFLVSPVIWESELSFAVLALELGEVFGAGESEVWTGAGRASVWGGGHGGNPLAARIRLPARVARTASKQSQGGTKCPI